MSTDPDSQESTTRRGPKTGLRGTVLDFSMADSSGAIAGDDQARYYFGGADWKSQGALPNQGSRVDFVPDETFAREIYLVPNEPRTATEAPIVPIGGPPYSGLYRSSDEGILLGLCAGLAHKLGVSVVLVRVGMFLVTMFLLWFPYLIAFFLPKYPTKGVPSPA